MSDGTAGRQRGADSTSEYSNTPQRPKDWRQLALLTAVLSVLVELVLVGGFYGRDPEPIRKFDALALRETNAYVWALFVLKDCQRARRYDATGLCDPYPGYYLLRGSQEVDEGCCVHYELIAGSGRGEYSTIRLNVYVYDTDPPDLSLGVSGGGFCTCDDLWASRIRPASETAS